MESIIAKTEKQLNDAFFVRKEVFVKEQHVPEEEEIDQFEDTSEHIVIYDGGQPVGAGRWRLKDGHGKLERICVMKSHRSLGVGAIIMQALEKAAAAKGAESFILHAQTQAVPFYEKQGYRVTSGEEFLDAGIPHLEMIKEHKR
ncbi:GNAT family N-acetyltransferase [Bacillus velezensis]|uniref:GNAT family N-acetyltransferase n=1 Tax=Bacillus amyloliquefaciens group TaxID=1938374 RepID=UPI0007A5F444|nr:MULTISPECIES: GNAT family N-acetyltransferase [Bacillus amyloliquefaciens group]MBN7741631.1 GNAT family N-acetyltransferase [Bacillus velezensis]MDX7983548.1 GNAT family N-acetyltransferase [Bacillus velezensis]MEA1004205.1 GNAT family N-acetyltransferase [Bacillus velezensis]MEC1106012.1 GNAT family N-acetyltransferase [Bacillus velezensis]OQC79080.1 GNAT family N-acetyltransferase [Bacillus velezensis]